MQPVYEASKYKIQARQENLNIYNKITGLSYIPSNRGYWTLCNFQSDNDGSEISQLVNSGFITKEQFYGVDRDSEIINHNRDIHPEANWFCGDWTEIIQNCDNFNPALIYLDTTSFADHSIAGNMVIKTMMLCPKDTLLMATQVNLYHLDDGESHLIVANSKEEVLQIGLEWLGLGLTIEEYIYGDNPIIELIKPDELVSLTDDNGKTVCKTAGEIVKEHGKSGIIASTTK